MPAFALDVLRVWLARLTQLPAALCTPKQIIFVFPELALDTLLKLVNARFKDFLIVLHCTAQSSHFHL